MELELLCGFAGLGLNLDLALELARFVVVVDVRFSFLLRFAGFWLGLDLKDALSSWEILISKRFWVQLFVLLLSRIYRHDEHSSESLRRFNELVPAEV